MQHQNKVSKQLWSNKFWLFLKWISHTVVNYQLRRSLFSQTSSNINNRTLTSHHFDKILQPYTHTTHFFLPLLSQSQQADSFSSSSKENFMRKITLRCLSRFIISCDTQKRVRSFTGLWKRTLNVLNDTKLILGNPWGHL